jgi:hypothetical protein
MKYIGFISAAVWIVVCVMQVLQIIDNHKRLKRMKEHR